MAMNMYRATCRARPPAAGQFEIRLQTQTYTDTDYVKIAAGEEATRSNSNLELKYQIPFMYIDQILSGLGNS